MILPVDFIVTTLINSAVIAAIAIGSIWISRFLDAGFDVKLSFVAQIFVGATLMLFAFGSLIHFVVLIIQVLFS